MWDCGRRNIKLDQAKIIDIDPLCGDSGFNMEVFIVKKEYQRFI